MNKDVAIIFPFFNCNMIVRCQAINISYIPIYRLRERHIHTGSPNYGPGRNGMGYSVS